MTHTGVPMSDTLSITTANSSVLIVTFRIRAQQYGLPVTSVIEIVRLPALVTLAGSPKEVLGLLNLRGTYLPVLSGHLLMGETPSYGVNSQIVVAGKTQGCNLYPVLGILVDQVIDVYTFSIHQCTTFGHNIAAPFLEGVIKTGERSILLLDTDALRDMIPEGTVVNPSAERHRDNDKDDGTKEV